MSEAKNEASANGATSNDLLGGNQWDSVDDFLVVLNKMRANEWQWVENTKCKYVELRVDMRNGCCIIRDRYGRRISPAQLAKQLDA